MSRIQELIQDYQLKAHPEGGYYAEVYRSPAEIDTAVGTRNLITSIYFLLTSKDISRFHVIKSDELWFHHEGSDLSVHVLDETGYQNLLLGKDHPEARAQQLVPAGKIFGSTVDDEDTYALVSCVVAPGFDFKDFRLCGKEELLVDFPHHKAIIERLT